MGTHLPTTKTANMIIYKDILTGDEIISDSYDLKEVDGAVYEVDCAMITLGAVEVNTVANSFRLNSTQFDKKSYLSHLKTYMKKVKEALKEKNAPEETITAFEKGAQAYAKKIVANFKDYDFYIGESMDPDGMVVLMNYREDGVTPFVTVWKHGLVEMKV